MKELPRREFLRKSAGVLGAASVALLPRTIRRALAVQARVATGTIQDVKHVVILMQENRSFSHYLGTLRGVRGFGDRFERRFAGRLETHRHGISDPAMAQHRT